MEGGPLTRPIVKAFDALSPRLQTAEALTRTEAQLAAFGVHSPRCGIRKK